MCWSGSKQSYAEKAARRRLQERTERRTKMTAKRISTGVLAASVMLAGVVGTCDSRVAAGEEKLLPGDLVVTAED